MAICEKCGTEKRVSKYSLGRGRQDKLLCRNCWRGYMRGESLLSEEELRKLIENAPKIKCPFCEQWFPKLTEEQYRASAEMNVLKYAIVPAWGVVGALKNKPYIECPHCKMKLMQG